MRIHLFLYIIIAVTGIGFTNLVAALFIVGLGWNFLFIGGSSLLTKVYRPEEKEKTQAFNDFTVFTAMAIFSFFAGSLYNNFGWNGVSLVLLPLLIITLIVAIKMMKASGKVAH